MLVFYWYKRVVTTETHLLSSLLACMHTHLLPFLLSGAVKKNSIFKDIAQIGGQPHFKKIKRNEFLTKVGEGGGHKTYCKK